MTDVEMDLDAIHQPSLELPLDDDLINYDSDAADYSLAADQNLADTTAPDVITDANASAESANLGGDHDAEQRSEDHTMGSAAEVADHVPETNADEQQDVEHAAEPELPLDADTAEAALDAITDTIADEIDYSLGEADYSGEQNTEEMHEEIGEVPNVLEEAGEEAGADAEEEKAEISWEDDAVVVPTAEVEQERNDEEQHAVQEDADQMNEFSVQGNVEEDENESRDYRQDELQALEDAITGDASMDAAGDFQTEHTESRFPSITVQYQGDEFPFLSSGSEGFFSDSSILDDSMQNVFSGFRAQLGNEIGAEDELVFQVDELGLEFTESNISSTLTMHQILEIFELLIKNDDPDGSRTLYTYLFTRLNNARRYEFLVESATSGKGLEEIQHLFPQQPSHNDSDADNGDDSAVSSEHAQDHGEDSYAHEQDENAEDHEHKEEHVEHEPAYTEQHAGEHGEEYHEEAADDHEEVEYFDEAAEQETSAITTNDDAVTAEPAKDIEAAEQDDSFAHEHSSTTSTLQGDADGTALADDETAVDAEADGPVFVTEDNDDAEIDWRDDDENDLVGDGGSVTGKRSRDDNDEPDVDDEIDFKRRRP